MKTEVIGHHAFQSFKVSLDAGESFTSEAGKMVRMSSNIENEVKTVKRSGGIMGALKRMVSGDSFFMSNYTAQGGPGEVVLAPDLPGNVGYQELDGKTGWYCAGGSYMASGPEIKTEPEWLGAKALFSGESLMYVRATGIGPLVMDAFGVISEEHVDGTFIVDTGHVVAFEDTLEFSISKAGGSWLNSFLAGEGIVLNFSGKGRVLVQSHNRTEFGQALGPMLPVRG